MHQITLSYLLIIGTILISITKIESTITTTLAPGSLVNNQVKTNQRGVATTTLLPTAQPDTTYSTVRVCLYGSISDGNGGCYYADTCEMLYGACDCEMGNTICCKNDECGTSTYPIVCGPGSRNRRCVPPPIPTVAEPTAAHNKCQKK